MANGAILCVIGCCNSWRLLTPITTTSLPSGSFRVISVGLDITASC